MSTGSRNWPIALGHINAQQFFMPVPVDAQDVFYGRKAKAFTSSVFSVTGIEISETAIDLAQKTTEMM